MQQERKNLHTIKAGMLGGGQLGRMLIQEAINLDLFFEVMDPDQQAPCSLLSPRFVCGDLNNKEDIISFAQQLNLLTIEIEHVNIDALSEIENQGIQVFPQPHALRIIQDKGLQKLFCQEHHIPTAPFNLIDSGKEAMHHPLPFVLKLRKGGYDGKGVQVIRNNEDLQHLFEGACIVEEMISFEKEISVIAARDQQGNIVTYPPVEMDFNAEANLVEYLISPARIEYAVSEQATALATSIIEKLQLTGILAIEMFLTNDGILYVNEMAPRPHNSGHTTIEGNVTSQYAQHIRAITGLPLGSTEMIRPAVMLNLLGEKNHNGPVYYEGLEEILKEPGVYVHLYGKKQTRPFRKMGHITVTANRIEEAIEKARRIKHKIKVISH